MVTTPQPRTPPRIAVRPARPDDAGAMGDVHVHAWRAAYAGLMPRDYLDGLDAAVRAAYWERALLAAPERPDQHVVVGTLAGTVVGFAGFGRPVDEMPPGTGELHALNVRPEAWGTGAGAALLTHVHAGLAAAGYLRAVLWVVPGNARARRFYERHGWRAEAVERTAEVLGVTVPEVRYRRALDAPSATATRASTVWDPGGGVA